MFFAVQVTFQVATAHRDATFSAVLPVSKNEYVLSKCFTVAFLQILIAIPCAALSTYVLNPSGNPIGIDTNLAFFGLTLIGYGVFNLCFLTQYFKHDNKLWRGFVVALPVYIGSIAALELLVDGVPTLNAIFGGLDSAYLWARGVLLAVGVLFYIGSFFVGYRIAAKNYSRADVTM